MPLPFVSHVGVQIGEASPGTSVVQLELAPHHMNSQGIAHGGALFTLADTGMGVALYSVLESGARCATIEIKINYFSPASDGVVVCRSAVVHRTRSYAVLESTLSLGEAAKAIGTFAIQPPRVQGAA